MDYFVEIRQRNVNDYIADTLGITPSGIHASSSEEAFSQAQVSINAMIDQHLCEGTQLPSQDLPKPTNLSHPNSELRKVSLTALHSIA